jgi:hypothetical protein
MSFDARSRERLQALGRSLPQKLPPPAPRPAAGVETTPEPRQRHRVESEQDPVALFHALIEASPDGSVPPHLLERLRSLEQPASQPAGWAAEPDSPSPGAGAAKAAGVSTTSPAPSPGPRRRRGGPLGPVRRGGGSDRDLYDAFDDLLRGEADDQPDPPPTARRAPDPRLQPRPTLRNPRFP